jgi:Ni/Co efflux regulator RcnB
MRAIFLPLFVACGLFSGSIALADDEDDMAEMQKRLNAEVMQKPFTVEDAAKVDAYVQDAMKKNLKPKQTAPKTWRPGYTCNDLWRYSYYDYRDCVYYHRYYGRYW